MKQIILFLTMALMFVGLQAQTAARPLKIQGSQLLNYQSPIADTVNKNVIKWVYFFTDNVLVDSKVQAYISTGRTYATNKPKVRILQQGSLDNVNWVHLDSASSINGTGLYAVTAKVTPFIKYYRIGIRGIDSVQTTTFRLNAIFVQP